MASTITIPPTSASISTRFGRDSASIRSASTWPPRPDAGGRMTISLDMLRNGLALEKDLVFAERPAHPEMRESTSIWMFDEKGAFGFPRMGVEAEAACWDDRLFQANFAFADGRVMNGAGRGAPPSPFDPDGRPTVLGAGSISFRCIEPFRRWSMVFDGSAIDGHVSQQIARTLDPSR